MYAYPSYHQASLVPGAVLQGVGLLGRDYYGVPSSCCVRPFQHRCGLGYIDLYVYKSDSKLQNKIFSLNKEMLCIYLSIHLSYNYSDIHAIHTCIHSPFQPSPGIFFYLTNANANESERRPCNVSRWRGLQNKRIQHQKGIKKSKAVVERITHQSPSSSSRCFVHAMRHR